MCPPNSNMTNLVQSSRHKTLNQVNLQQNCDLVMADRALSQSSLIRRQETPKLFPPLLYQNTINCHHQTDHECTVTS